MDKMTATETSLKHVDIQFSNLSYHIKNKTLLNGLSGQFLGGQLTGILGSSGAGKTTLLNILAGQIRCGISGNIYVNGRPRDDKLFHRISSYIMQDDILQPRLSVKELMFVAADLKLGSHHTENSKDEIIQHVLIAMRLDKCINTRTENLSGGQKKRLCIALELVSNPPVVFLDEPTTGLDDVSTRQCMALLKSLAQQGKTIICTIHQPSNTIFQLFDQVYFMTEGNCVYSGTTRDIIPFLEDVGKPCPEAYSPADYLIELAQSEKCVTIMKNQNDKKRAINMHNRNYKGYINPYYIDSTSSTVFAVCFWAQFWTLFKRRILQISRNRLTTTCEIGHHIFCGIIVGLIFFNRGNNAKYLVDNIKLFYGIIIYFMFSHGMIIALTFPTEVSLLQREYFNMWYSLKAYFLVKNLTMLPVSCIGALLFSVIVYTMSGQPLETNRIILFLLIGILYVIATQGFGLVIGAIFNPVNGACIGSAIGMTLLLLASYNMGAGEITSPIMKGLMNFSYAYHGYVGFGVSAFSNREILECPDIFCLFSDPSLLLKQVGMEHAKLHEAALYLILFTVFHRILAYGFLKAKLKPESKLYQVLK